MKRLLIASSIIIGMMMVAPVALATNDDAPGQNKVTICHVTPGQSVTLTIPEDEANGHLTGKAAGHDLNGPVEDYLGECNPEPSPTPTPTETVYVPVPGPTVTVTPEPAPTVTVTATATVTTQPVPAPTVTVTTAPDETFCPVEPVTEATPEAPTLMPSASLPNSPNVPNSVPAGDGSSQDDEISIKILFVLLGILAVFFLGFAVGRLTSLK